MLLEQTARCLGWASLGIGLAELAATEKVEELLGIEKNHQNTGVLRTLGVREIMHGIDILTHDDPTPAVWGRVAGDMLDGAIMGVAATKSRNPAGFTTATAMVLGIGLLDLLVARGLSDRDSRPA